MAAAKNNPEIGLLKGIDRLPPDITGDWRNALYAILPSTKAWIRRMMVSHHITQNSESERHSKLEEVVVDTKGPDGSKENGLFAICENLI